jgi:UDP-2,3-diacylglucosamine hydrolase
MSAVFISDLHLSPERPAATQAFLGFCEELRIDPTERLYILGDLFEAWIGDDDRTEFAEQIVAALKSLHEVGIQVFFQRGNRDFLLGSGFAWRSGASLLPDYHVAREFGQRLLLMHGDLLCTDDLDYQRFRRRVQNPVNRWLLAHMPIIWRRRLAQRWRSQSAMANANKPENIMDVNADAVVRAMTEQGVNILIHGHTHRPARHAVPLESSQGERLVLGDWGDSAWWIRVDSAGLNLESALLSNFTS